MDAATILARSAGRRLTVAPQPTTTAAPTSPPGPLAPQTLTWIALGFILVGVAGRLLRYGLRFPIWGDESFICLNFPDRDYFGLTRQLECEQVAPVLFLWAELFVYRLLGTSELALRLLPLLAGLASLGLFWHLARRLLSPLAATLAIGLLAVARWPVSMSCLVKPYSFDLFFALVLIVPAVRWLQKPNGPHALGWLVLLSALTPFALLGSYPAVFVAGGVSLALLPATWRLEWRSGWPAKTAYLAYNLLMIGSFLTCFLLIGREQLDPQRGTVDYAMRVYWADGFPPGRPLELLGWFLKVHTGRLMAYPVGDGNGGSTATFLLVLIGVGSWWRSGRRELLVLALTPFALGLVAAALERYPYGACCRLSQHVAPAICLLAGTGLAVVLERWVTTATARQRWLWTLTGLFVLCGVGGMAADLAKPYRDQEAVWCRKLVQELEKRAAPEDQIVVLTSPGDVWPLLRWQLRSRGDRVTWQGQIDWARLEQTGGRLWCLWPWTVHGAPDFGRPPLPGDFPDGQALTLVQECPFRLRPTLGGDPVLHCLVRCYRPTSASRGGAETAVMTCSP